MSVEASAGAAPDVALGIASSAALAGPAQPLPASRARLRSESIAIVATVAIPLIALLLCIAGTRTVALLAQTIQLAPPASLAGPLHDIGFSLTLGEAIAVLILLVLTYLLVLRRCEHVPLRVVIWSIVAFNVIVLLGPPLFSSDVFSYQAYARMFAVYHTNPYVHTPIYTLYLDHSLLPYVAQRWNDTPTVYGPLFTLLSSAFASSSVAFSEFAFKLIAAASSGGTVWLIWRSARLREVDAKRAIAFFGLNPMVTLYAVGGGHNDMLMLLLTTGGLYALLIRRDEMSGALMAAGAAIKLTGAIVLPFAFVSDLRSQMGGRRRALVLGAAAVSVVIAAASAVFFGWGILRLPGTLQRVQALGAWWSIPGALFHAAGVRVTSAVRTGFDVCLGGIVLWLLYRVWRGCLDWIDGAAWATFAVLITAWYLLPWYACWMMPLVALSRSRRVWQAGIAMTVIASAVMVAGCFPTVNLLRM